MDSRDEVSHKILMQPHVRARLTSGCSSSSASAQELGDAFKIGRFSRRSALADFFSNQRQELSDLLVGALVNVEVARSVIVAVAAVMPVAARAARPPLTRPATLLACRQPDACPESTDGGDSKRCFARAFGLFAAHPKIPVTSAFAAPISPISPPKSSDSLAPRLGMHNAACGIHRRARLAWQAVCSLKICDDEGATLLFYC